jgi:hypothetical protein
VTTSRLAALQWTGLVAGVVVWSVEHIAGYGFTDAECKGGAPWGIGNDTWQGTLMAIGLACLLAAEAAAVTVLLQTRGTSYEAPPALGRIRFLAIAAALANGLFILIVLLSGIASIADVPCRQA